MIDRVDRVLLGLLGLLLVLAGAAGLLVAYGVLAAPEPAQVYEDLAAAVSARRQLWLAAFAVAAVLVTLLGLLLVRAQLTRPSGGGVGTFTAQRTARGSTTVEATAVAQAAARDLRTLRGVRASTARLQAVGERPRLLARLDLEPDADGHRVLDDAEQVYERLCRVLGVDGVEAEVVLGRTGNEHARVT